MPPTRPPRPEYDETPIHGPGFRSAEGLVGPTGIAVTIRPVSLQWRGAREGCGSGAREGCGSGAYKSPRAPLN